MKNDFLDSAKKQFEYYKILGEKTFAQLSDEQLFWQYNEESNSIATIVKHLWGNILSRWTDSLTTDDLKKEIFIRNQGHTITEAINRQLAHYSISHWTNCVYWKKDL